MIEVGDEGIVEVAETEEDAEQVEEAPEIWIHAIIRAMHYATMKMEDMVEGRRMQLLIDSGNTHNILDSTMAAKLGCQREEITPLMVLVANGNEMKYN